MPFGWGKKPEPKVPSDMWSAAPPGGRTFRFRDFGYEIWIPEGWKMGGEEAAPSERARPTFYRERDPHGAMRVSKQGSGTPDVLEATTRLAESLRNDPKVEQLEVEARPNRVQLSWRQRINEPGMDSLTLTRSWIISERTGVLFVTFSIDSRDEGSPAVQDEIAAVTEIVAKLVPL